MARSRKLTITLNSIDDCTKSMGDLLKATLELEKLTAERDMRIAEASSTSEKDIDMWRQYAAEQSDALQHYYLTHIAEMEKDGKRSYQLPNGIIGRRLSPEKLTTLSKSWTWKAALSALQARFPGKYVRTPEVEIDKDLIKAELDAENLKRCGMRLTQDDKFFAEPIRLPAPSEVTAA